MSRMWLAWISLSLNGFISFVRAASASCEARMILMTSSMWSRAISSPWTM